LSHKLFNLLDTPIRSTHHIGETSHFNYPTEPILDILAGVNHLHDITSLGEKRLIYEGFYRLHHRYNKKVIMARFNNLIDLKQTVRLHMIQIHSNLYDDYLKTNDFLEANPSLATHFGEQKYSLANDVLQIRVYKNQNKRFLTN